MPFFNPPNLISTIAVVFFFFLSNCCHRWAFILCCQPGQILLEYPQNPRLPPGSVFLSEQVGAISLISTRVYQLGGLSCRLLCPWSRRPTCQPFSLLPPCLPAFLCSGHLTLHWRQRRVGINCRLLRFFGAFLWLRRNWHSSRESQSPLPTSPCLPPACYAFWLIWLIDSPHTNAASRLDIAYT